MASNGLNLPPSCDLCKLTGQFNASGGTNDPIVDIVKAADVKILPWPWETKAMDAKNLSFDDLLKQTDVLWQTETLIDLRRDEIVKLKDDKAKTHGRSIKAEDEVTGAVR